MMRELISALAAACAIAGPACAAPDVSSGTATHGMTACVYEYKGEVGILEPGEQTWAAVQGAVQLREGARLRTGHGAWCRVLAGDGTFINLYEDSETAVETLRLEKDVRDYGFDFVKGRILWMAAKLKRAGSRFSIRTPSAVCAVRGTDFFIGVSSAATEIAMFDGQLEITSGGKETPLPAGSEAMAGPDSGVAVSGRLSRTMEAEKRRYLKLRKHVENLRLKLAAREGFIAEFVEAQQDKLHAFEGRRQEKLKALDK